MLKNLLYTSFRTLCPKIFTKSTNQIQQAITSSQTSGTYVAPICEKRRFYTVEVVKSFRKQFVFVLLLQ